METGDVTVRYELETPTGQRQAYTADAVSFEGGGVQLWKLVERPQAPPRRDLVGAWAPQAWVKLWPTEVFETEPHDPDLVADRREDEDGERL